MTSLLRRLTVTVWGPTPRAPPTQWFCRRCMATQSRTYDDALRLLATLPTNAAAKKLFEVQPQDGKKQDKKKPSGKKPNGKKRDPSRGSPNNSAIPEMLAWLARAGMDPQTIPLRAIHIAGSKGKGSTAAYASAILRAGMEGVRVGTYTSPHLVSVRERIALDGAPISKELFARYFFEVWDAVGCAPGQAPGGGSPSGDDGLMRPFFFRFMTILALHTFVREGIKDVVIECGIGGEYDATNILPASAVSATVITHVGMDHEAMLGGSKEKIAWHKAGIFRSGVPAFTAPQQPSISEVLSYRAGKKGAKLFTITRRNKYWKGRHTSATSEFDLVNRAVAAAAATYHMRGTIATEPLWWDVSWMSKAMDEAAPRGRWEVLREGPTTFYLDGAHTRDSLGAAAAWFLEKSRGRRRVLIFNQQERDASPLLWMVIKAIRPERFEEAIFCRSEVEGEGDLDVQEELAGRMRLARGSWKVAVESGVKGALERVRGKNVQVLVTGSMHLVGAALKVLEGESD